MSRIDDALKRLAGVVAPEPRTPPRTRPLRVGRGASSVDESRRDDAGRAHKIASFVAHGPRPVDARPAAATATVAALPPAPPGADAETEATSSPSRSSTSGSSSTTPASLAGRCVATSCWRRRPSALVLAMTAAAAVLLPRTYHVQTKLLAQRNAVMTALSNPGRAVPWDADAPTRAAAETVLRRDNLDLAHHADRSDSRVGAHARADPEGEGLARGAVTGHKPTPDDKLDALVGLLEERMIVEAGPVGDGTVTIELDWPDAEMAYRLVQAAQQAFLEARQVAETAAIGESIAILERYSTSLHADVNRTLAELQRQQPKARSGAPPRPRPTASPRRAPFRLWRHRSACRSSTRRSRPIPTRLV